MREAKKSDRANTNAKFNAIKFDESSLKKIHDSKIGVVGTYHWDING